MRRLLFACFALVISFTAAASSERDQLLERYKTYPFDYKTLESYEEQWQRYIARYESLKGANRQFTREERQELIDLIQGIHEKEPQWIDGYWLLASEKFQLASSFDSEEDLPLARKILAEGRDTARQCLKIQPENPMCKFFLASSLGKIGTIDGVFASLKGAKEVHDLWQDVKESDYNHYFTERISVQGSVRYAFGIFFRLVPDWFLVGFLFDVRGDLDASIKNLREAIIIDGAFPCSRLMLAASLFCRADGDRKSRDFKDALKQIDLIAEMGNMSVQSQTCKRDALKMKQEPSRGCGYSTAKQQDQGEEDSLKK